MQYHKDEKKLLFFMNKDKDLYLHMLILRATACSSVRLSVKIFPCEAEERNLPAVQCVLIRDDLMKR